MKHSITQITATLFLMMMSIQSIAHAQEILVKDSFDLSENAGKEAVVYEGRRPAQQTLTPQAFWKKAGKWFHVAPGQLMTDSHAALAIQLNQGEVYETKLPLTIKASMSPGKAEWCAVALGSENLAGDFFKNVQLLLILRPTGSFTGLIEAKTVLFQGKIADFKADDLHAMAMTYDPVSNTVSAMIDEKVIAKSVALEKHRFTPTLKAAGVYVLQKNEPCQTLLDDFVIQTEKPVQETAAPADIRWAPQAVTAFYVDPKTDSTLTFTAKPLDKAFPSQIGYTITDYMDKPVTQGIGNVNDKQMLDVSVNLATGYYTLTLEGGLSFGLTVQPAFTGNADPFFCIDSGLGWLVVTENHYTTYDHYAQRRDELIAVLKRTGIAKSRERVSWSVMQKSATDWDWQTDKQYDTLCDVYRKHDVKILEMTHSSPAFLGRTTGKRFPENLQGVTDAWRDFYHKRGDSWGGLEIWNEPNISFGGNRPADQYIPLLKSVTYAMQQVGCNAPIGGPALAGGYDVSYLRNFAANGGLDTIDYYSFHTYSHATAMQSIVENHRATLDEFGHASLPLWITESGRPWNKGTDRANSQQDRISALDNVMKAVEAKACGISSYFLFVYPFYEEKSRNFGILDRHGTPLRPMAGYANVINMIGNMDYLGDLPVSDALIQRARVFGNDNHAVVVLYAPLAKDDSSVSVTLPADQCFGIDGRAMSITQQGKLPIPDGVCYVTMDRKQLPTLKTDTTAMRLWELSRKEQTPRPQTSPLVMQFMPDEKDYDIDVKGYRINTQEQTVAFPVRVCNLDDKPQQVQLTLMQDGQPYDKSIDVSLKGRETQQVQWMIPCEWHNQLQVTLSVNATTQAPSAPTPLPISINLIGEPSFAKLMEAWPRKKQITIDDQTRWTMTSANDCDPRMNFPGMGLCQIEATFQAGKDNWIYPRLALTDDVKPQEMDGVVLEMRAVNTSAVRWFSWEQTSHSQSETIGYITPPSLIPGDEQWHAVYIPWENLVLSGANAMDPNNKLDLDLVKRISIGFNGKAGHNTLQIRQAWLVGK